MPTTTQENPGCLASILRIFGRGSDIPHNQHAPEIEGGLPYRLRDDFLSPTEHSFYHVLLLATDNRATICPKVNLGDIFYVPRSEGISYRNKIDRKHVDYLLCDIKTMKPILGIELDDSTHSRTDREERDEVVDGVFEAAGLPLLRVVAKRSFDARELATQLAPYLNPSETEPEPQPVYVTASVSTARSVAPVCPKCGGQMVVRTVKQGEQRGKQFYGCTNFPNCRQMLPIT